MKTHRAVPRRGRKVRDASPPVASAAGLVFHHPGAGVVARAFREVADDPFTIYLNSIWE